MTTTSQALRCAFEGWPIGAGELLAGASDFDIEVAGRFFAQDQKLTADLDAAVF